MTSLERIQARLAIAEPRTADGEARAAVAAILRERERGPEVLFIRRAEHPRDPWSGHMAFPGGRLEPSDPGLEATAVRETREEIGLYLPEYGERLGQLDDVPTHKSGLVVRPFVWRVDALPALRLNHEVAEALWVDLASLMRGERDTTYELEWNGQKLQFPGYAVGDRVVWGLTYRMLEVLFERVRD